MYISIVFVLTQSFVKNGYFFVASAKKTKHIAKRLILILNLVIFYIDHVKYRFFLKRLHGHKEHENIHKTFLFGTFQHF
jgi:hypothetical protein